MQVIRVLSGHDVSKETSRAEGVAFGRPMRIVGWLCVIGTACVIIEMVTVLPYMQDEWRRPPGELQLPPGQFDFRGMGIMHPGLLGWFGAWGYLAAFPWIPIAVWRAYRARRRAIPIESQARVLLVLVPTLFLLAQALLRLTVLKYEYPLI